jgi:UDP-N-acetylglucosamine:LPS N-acetylglucosamine transferase
VQVAVILGGAQGAHQLRKWVKAAQWKQKQLIKEVQSQQTAQNKQRSSSKVAVDSVFFKRLWTILSM